MPAVVCFGLDSALVDQVRRVAGTAESADDESTLRSRLCAQASTVLLYALPAHTKPQLALWSAVESAREKGTRVAVLAVAVAGHSSYAAVFDGARTGVAALIMASPRFDLHDLALALQEASAALAASRVWDSLERTISRPLAVEAETLLRRTVALSHAPVSLAQLAEACGLHERSLRKYCTRHALPEPQRLIAFARLLRAALLLDDGLPLPAVCSDLGFASIDALRKLASRTVHSPIGQWPQGEAARTVAVRFARELVGEAGVPGRRLVLLA